MPAIEEQADEIMRLLEVANDAATKVKTFAADRTTAEALLGSDGLLSSEQFGDFESEPAKCGPQWLMSWNAGIGTFSDAIQGVLIAGMNLRAGTSGME